MWIVDFGDVDVTHWFFATFSRFFGEESNEMSFLTGGFLDGSSRRVFSRKRPVEYRDETLVGGLPKPQKLQDDEIYQANLVLHVVWNINQFTSYL